MKITFTFWNIRGLRMVLLSFIILSSTHFTNAQSFSQSTLQGATILNPTSLQFGPDSNLYVAQQNGLIKVFTIQKMSTNNYKVINTQEIHLVRQIPNHYDDGTARPYNIGANKRQITGILTAGTPTNPIVYVASSDNEIGAGDAGDINLCTNSGIISKLYKDGGVWKKIDLVRGLPRSEENHAPNGMQLHNNKLYIAIGGFTNAGGVSNAWTYITEYALSAAILSIDLTAIEAMSTKMDPTGNHPYKYDIPTLDDPTRTNNPDGTDVNDPWGGNDGLNQAKIVPGGPVQLYATGLRNPYDILITQDNKFYTIDNGPNRNWGGWPVNQGSDGTVTNDYDPNETGTTQVTNYDGLELIGDVTTYDPSVDMYYGGHPCPIRANPSGAGLYTFDGTHRGWRNDNSDPNLPLPSDWPPIPVSMANPEEGEYHDPGSSLDKSLITFNTSTNGFCEYTANGDMKGDLLACGFDGKIYRIRFGSFGEVENSLGPKKLNQDAPFATGFGNKPLDITAQGDNDIFRGTIWVAVWGASSIAVFEPQNNSSCTGADNAALDEDGDGFTNADEIDNGTNPCAGSSRPSDNDGDQISDLNDTDDDNDGINDKEDLFCIDPDNGLTTTMPTHYHLFNFDPGTGFYGLGFTGLMCNGTTDYITLFEENNLIAGGAVGAFTVEEVPPGDAKETNNDQKYAFQFGLKTAGSSTFTVRSGVLPLFFDGQTPSGNQSQGIYIGTGDQDNYLKVTLDANGGTGGINVVHEKNGVIQLDEQYPLSGPIPNSSIRFYIVVEPANNLATVYYSIDHDNVISLGDPIILSGPLLNAINNPAKAMAVGVIATSRDGAPFNATWDYLEVFEGVISSIHKWNDGSITNKIHLFPNPTRDRLNINVETNQEATFRIRIFNNTGKLIDENEMSWNATTSNQINVANLLPGVYHIQFIDEKENRSASMKFIRE